MNEQKRAARKRRRHVIKTYLRGTVMLAGSFGGLAVALALLR